MEIRNEHVALLMNRVNSWRPRKLTESRLMVTKYTLPKSISAGNNVELFEKCRRKQLIFRSLQIVPSVITDRIAKRH
jgi:hypothetical protein